MSELVDLNTLLANILVADESLKEATAFAKEAEADRLAAVATLTAAQSAFDAAVRAARGIVAAPEPPAPVEPPQAAPAPAGPQPDMSYLTKKIPMGPLPSTSPALHTLPGAIDEDDDNRPDAVYDADADK
jgi:hypothetical protein